MSSSHVFISYAREGEAHNGWVAALATRLRADGVEVLLDQWSLVPGDQLPAFMENGVRNASHVLVVCTPKYKLKSDARDGGVGYEGDIMTAEVFMGEARRKFVPVLRAGPWRSAAPSWLLGSLYVDLSASPYSAPEYSKLLATLHGTLVQPPPLGPAPASTRSASGSPISTAHPLLKVGDLVVLESEYLVPRRETHEEHRERLHDLQARKRTLTRADADRWETVLVDRSPAEAQVKGSTATEFELAIIGRPLNVAHEDVDKVWRRADGRVALTLKRPVEVPTDAAGWLKLSSRKPSST